MFTAIHSITLRAFSAGSMPPPEAELRDDLQDLPLRRAPQDPLNVLSTPDLAPMT